VPRQVIGDSFTMTAAAAETKHQTSS